MKYREYRFFSKIYHRSPHLNDNQRYKDFFISEIEQLGYDKTEILAMIKAFPEYLSCIENSDGYAHCVSLTPRCVSAIKHYKFDVLWSVMRSIVIPAIVSILCSLIVSA